MAPDSATFALTLVGALVYLVAPVFPLLALARRGEGVLALVFGAICYALPAIVAVVLTDTDRPGAFTDAAYFLLYGPIVAAVASVVIVFAVYVFAWRFKFVLLWRLI